jgi:hypothetical protein
MAGRSPTRKRPTCLEQRRWPAACSPAFAVRMARSTSSALSRDDVTGEETTVCRQRLALARLSPRTAGRRARVVGGRGDRGSPPVTLGVGDECGAPAPRPVRGDGHRSRTGRYGSGDGKPGTAGASQRDARPSGKAAAGRGLGGQVRQGKRAHRTPPSRNPVQASSLASSRQPSARWDGVSFHSRCTSPPLMANLRCVLQRLGRGPLFRRRPEGSFPCSRWLGNVPCVTLFLAPE